jgi:hypothetical protein
MEARADAPAFRGRALGIHIDADRPVLALLADREPSSGTLALRSVESVPRLPEPSRRLAELRGAAGEPFLTIDWHPELGYRIEAAGHGCHLLSPDGRSAACVPDVGESWAWHRLFFAQVLPSAAALQGLEVLHASAVAIEGEATAIVSASGGGKTSVAVRMLARGAGFVTDDVLAVERGEGSVMAHPGPAFVSVDEAGLEALPEQGEQLGGSDKADVAVEPIARAIPLGRLVFLQRDQQASRLSLVPLSPPDPRLLLAATFTSHLTARRRLAGQLETCAAIARQVPCFRLVVPPGETPAAAAAALLDG